MRDRSVTSLQHLTLSTGHVTASPRSGVGDAILRQLAPLVRKGSGHLGYEDWCLWTIERFPDGVFWQIEADGERDRPFVICATCWRNDPDLTVWRAILDMQDAMPDWQPPAEALKVPAAPWLGVITTPAITLIDPIEVGDMGDAERCIAWAQILGAKA